MEKGQDIGHTVELSTNKTKPKSTYSDDFVLEKSIFNNVFEKDIRKIFIYKKAERLAKAIHLIAPAFSDSVSLKNRIDAVAIGLVDAAILPSSASRTALSRELLTLSSILSIARAGSLLSSMNTELIVRETHILLQEVAEYEEPRISFDETPTLSGIAKKAVSQDSRGRPVAKKSSTQSRAHSREPQGDKGHIKDIGNVSDTSIKDRREAIMSVIKNKEIASIKDISTVIRGVSEKTIQRELITLVAAGMVLKKGERRWSIYSLK
jgi:DNA-binding transcriptional ArsR family regulator